MRGRRGHLQLCEDPLLPARQHDPDGGGGRSPPSLPAPGLGSLMEELKAGGVCPRGILRAEIPELGLPTSEGLPKVSCTVFRWGRSKSQGAKVIGFAG